MCSCPELYLETSSNRISSDAAILKEMCMKIPFLADKVDALVQERRNSSANALELRISCTNPSETGPSES